MDFYSVLLTFLWHLIESCILILFVYIYKIIYIYKFFILFFIENQNFVYLSKLVLVYSSTLKM